MILSAQLYRGHKTEENRHRVQFDFFICLLGVAAVLFGLYVVAPIVIFLSVLILASILDAVIIALGLDKVIENRFRKGRKSR